MQMDETQSELRDLRDLQFAQIESGLLRDPDIPDPLIRLYGLLLSYGPSNIFPGQTLLAKQSGTTRETVNRRLRKLQVLGLIDWQPHPTRSTNVYYILGYANHLALKSASAEGVTAASHPTNSGVTAASQGVCPGDHRGCDATVTRSRSMIQIQEPHGVGGGQSGDPPGDLSGDLDAETQDAAELIEGLGIAPDLAQSLAAVDPGLALDWCEYVRGRASVRDPAAFVISKLRAGARPPRRRGQDRRYIGGEFADLIHH